jgi:hypothetical protein
MSTIEQIDSKYAVRRFRKQAVLACGNCNERIHGPRVHRYRFCPFCGVEVHILKPGRPHRDKRTDVERTRDLYFVPGRLRSHGCSDPRGRGYAWVVRDKQIRGISRDHLTPEELGIVSAFEQEKAQAVSA